MEPQLKITHKQNLHVDRVFCLIAGDGESELASKIAAIIISYASEVLNCVKMLDSHEGDDVVMELLEQVLPSVFYVMQNCEVDYITDVMQFLMDYVAMMKLPTQKQLVHLGKIMEVIKAKITYNPMYRSNLDLPDKIGKEVEDEMGEHRKNFFTLTRSVYRVAPHVTLLFIRGLLANVLNSSEMNVEDVEATLSLFCCLGESINNKELRTGAGRLKEMIIMLLLPHFHLNAHRIVALVYLETTTRYMKFVQENSQYIPQLLTGFLDKRGIHHPNPSVRQRAIYLFMKAVKLLKSQLIPFTEKILQSLQDTVARLTSLDWSSKEARSLSSEEGGHTFAVIGLLIGMEEMIPEKQAQYLSAILTPLFHQVELLLLDANPQLLEESSSMIQQVTVAINALSKGFSERLVIANRPTIGAMFKQTLDVLIKVLDVFPKAETLRKKIISFLHRMVEILGVLEKLLAQCEPKEMVDFLLLINQLICKFKSSLSGLLEDIFPTVASELFRIPPKDVFPSGAGSNTEEIRELHELHRTFYSFLHVLIMHHLSSVLLAPKCMEYLNVIMQLLVFTCCSHKDSGVRKTCVQIIVRLIKDWCTKYNGEEKVPGFRAFIFESFATNCCLFSVLDSSFNFQDVNTLLLFGEITVAQKVMYEKFGNDFLFHFVTKGLLPAHCSQELAEQYYHKFQGDDVKALKSFYQSLVENLRQEQTQTESLVLR